MYVVKRDGRKEPVSFSKIEGRIHHLCDGLQIDQSTLAQKVISNMKSGMRTSEIDDLAARMAASRGVYHPDFLTLAGRIEVANLHSNTTDDILGLWKTLCAHTHLGKPSPLVDPEILPFVEQHRDALQNALDFDRDFEISYFGLKTLQRAYLIRDHEGTILERPGMMWMRVAIGLHQPDVERTLGDVPDPEQPRGDPRDTDPVQRRHLAAPTVQLLPPQHPVGLHRGDLRHPEAVRHDIEACRWHRPRAQQRKGPRQLHPRDQRVVQRHRADAESIQQLRPLRGPGRRAKERSFAIYLEPWHADVYEFLELKLPHGNMNARAHDLFYGMWICDIFMCRVQEDGEWSLMCPNECPGLTTTYGDEFEILYTTYEAMPEKVRKRVKARDLWFKILQAQIESGTPYMLYKDAVNRKSNQKNVGVIKSSNLAHGDHAVHGRE